jgi:hypothetical protein
MKKVSINCHPDYDKMYPIWQQLYVTTVLGEAGVKLAGELYLPKTEGQVEDKEDGTLRYNAYKARAIYYNFCQQTIKKAMGIIHTKDGVLVAGKKVTEWTKAMTIDGEDIQSLARDISSAQLLLGRLGLLLDYPATKSSVPYVTKYSADSMLCWEEGMIDNKKKLKWILLDDSHTEFDPETKEYVDKESFRLLALDKEGRYYSVVLDAKEWSLWDIENPSNQSIANEVVYPKMPKILDFIPFVPVNVKTTTMSMDKPLLVELSNLSLSAYRNDADYRQGLYHQAFSLLYMTGVNEDKMKKKGIRSDGCAITENDKAKIGYASAPADGLTEMRMSLEGIKAESEGNGIVINDKEGVESGTALKTRISLQTSDLREINLTAGEALNKILNMAKKCLGDTGEISYTPNLDFDQEKATTQEYLNLWNVCMAGGTSLKNVYLWAFKNNMAMEPTYELWLANIQETMSVLGYTPQGSSEDGDNKKSEKDNENV